MCTVAALQSDKVLGAALSHVDILHLNEEELVNITGVVLEGKDPFKDLAQIKKAASLFLECGVAVVAVMVVELPIIGTSEVVTSVVVP